MSFAAPLYLLGGAIVAAAVAALHFLARRSARPLPLPTVRFVPEHPVAAPRPTSRPRDLLLLALRLLVVILLAAAFARPERRGGGVVRVIVVDGSRAVQSPVEARDSARAYHRPGDAIVVFDSVGREIRGHEDIVTPGHGRGSLSGALVASLRAGARVAVGPDSVELVLISPFAREEWDAATLSIRALWPGRIRLVPIRAATPRPRGVETAATDDDPLGAALSLAGLRARDGRVHLRRERPTPADSALARERGDAIVFWPGAPDPAWPAGAGDTVEAVAAMNAVVVARFARPADPPAGAALAHWVDGRVAAVERSLGPGCQRDVAIPLPAAGDLALAPATRALVAALVAPCGGADDFAVPPEVQLAALRGAGPLAKAADLPRPAPARVPASGWLLAAAAVLVAGESLVRRRLAP
jgi:hypothetical protein